MAIKQWCSKVELTAYAERLAGRGFIMLFDWCDTKETNDCISAKCNKNTLSAKYLPNMSHGLPVFWLPLRAIRWQRQAQMIKAALLPFLFYH
jgi:hypothetical protein